ncbi:GNAT family N-acetyltransferase [Streptomyces europaeiscabiei]|uniref:GNAT family N-acetyltransferase n=2 Tax=Streptomyces europaeiscabiei TaxID=146819 RepID=A0ABU4NT16_9ACTN|nr:GNAT family N-acetyltransferase [Streptomyces europaeiscabiei]MDX3555313.1 GNAT family N-acetyltransferase [Streptomyces europaeiscabiei]MDX3705327.1 GNAT family N-acetyltransferase [Streptomyces europaeiscabiei]
MTETQAPLIHAASFDYQSDRDVEAVTLLFADYLLEGLDRLGHFPSGMPIANWLNTVVLYVDGIPAGFCAADLTRYAVELIYVAPAYRRKGIAHRLLVDLRDSCPEQMRIKAPLSPGCQALAEQLGIPVSAPTAEEEAKGEQAVAELHETIRRHCKHPRKGSPQRPCRRCYRALLRRMALAMVTDPCLALRQANRLLGQAS